MQVGVFDCLFVSERSYRYTHAHGNNFSTDTLKFRQSYVFTMVSDMYRKRERQIGNGCLVSEVYIYIHHGRDVTAEQFFNWVGLVWIQSFPSAIPFSLPKLKKTSLPYYLA